MPFQLSPTEILASRSSVLMITETRTYSSSTTASPINKNNLLKLRMSTSSSSSSGSTSSSNSRKGVSRRTPSTSSTSSVSSSKSSRSSSYSKNMDLIPAIDLILESNDALLEKLSNVRDNSLYFRLYSVDILGSCEYMAQELFECYTEKCEIYPEDDDEIPEPIRDQDRKDGVDLFVLDGWSRWDMPNNDYYDTQAFPEGYTGYDGSEVWKFIHERIAFNDYKYDDNNWKADFNKAVSGLHSMISAQVIRGIREKIVNGEAFSTDEIWKDPVAEYKRRLSSSAALGETPLALENLFFSFMLLLSAVYKAAPRYLAECESGLIDKDVAADLKSILKMPLLKDASIQKAASKLQKHGVDAGGASELWQARMRCRDLLRVMNCVQCNKCRFHGKVSAMGLITAFHIVLGQDGTGCDIATLNRVELSTLLTTVHKYSSAIQLCQELQKQ